MKGSHKITLTVEVDDGEGAFTQTQEFSSGNPIFHASEMFRASVHPLRKIKKAMEAVYGVRPDERESVGRVAFSDLAERIAEAQRKGGRVYRLVLLTGRKTSYYSEPLYLHQLETELGDKAGNPEVHEIQYGVPTANVYEYTWREL